MTVWRAAYEVLIEDIGCWATLTRALPHLSLARSPSVQELRRGSRTFMPWGSSGKLECTTWKWAGLRAPGER